MAASRKPPGPPSGRDISRVVSSAAGDVALSVPLNMSELTAYVGGQERDERPGARQARDGRRAESDTGRVFKIIIEARGEAVGHVAYEDRAWRGERADAIGWRVLPALQGQGIAGIAASRRDRVQRFMRVFPAIDNLPSNAICRTLGFALVGERDFEYPSGNVWRCSVWCFDRFANGQMAAGGGSD